MPASSPAPRPPLPRDHLLHALDKLERADAHAGLGGKTEARDLARSAINDIGRWLDQIRFIEVEDA